ncbi:MAG: hypothetical protein HY539_04700 [Deltaproteobacteria bacterium]|nr:hypothetical protein [Deltaproteobacteria bacterium]
MTQSTFRPISLGEIRQYDRWMTGVGIAALTGGVVSWGIASFYERRHKSFPFTFQGPVPGWRFFALSIIGTLGWNGIRAFDRLSPSHKWEKSDDPIADSLLFFGAGFGVMSTVCTLGSFNPMAFLTGFLGTGMNLYAFYRSSRQPSGESDQVRKGQLLLQTSLMILSVVLMIRGARALP